MLTVTESRAEAVGAFKVRRALPTKGRRTVGAWCFADHMGPADVEENSGLDVGPHPHIGLHTVTWLLDGQVLHKDSLGSEQVIRPGQLNLMTAGAGVVHAEERTGHYRGTIEGIQLWVVQPEATRHGPAAFEHHAELPRAELPGGEASVLVGGFAGARSAARSDTDLVGAELSLHAQAELELRPDFEYAVVVLRGRVGIDGEPLEPGHLGYLGSGLSELRLDVREPARVMLLGGVPFEAPVAMWWNFVARDRAELDAAYAAWAGGDERFGRVTSALPTIPAPRPFWRG